MEELHSYLVAYFYDNFLQNWPAIIIGFSVMGLASVGLLSLTASWGIKLIQRWTRPRPNTGLGLHESSSKNIISTTEVSLMKFMQEVQNRIHEAATKSNDIHFGGKCIEILQTLSTSTRTEVINDQTHPHKYTPFHYACVNGNLTLVKYMLKNGADVQLRAANGESPIFLAVFGFLEGISDLNLNLLKVLCAYGCKINSSKNHGYTPLHLAAKHGNFELVKWMVCNGANVEAKTVCNRTPYDEAISSGNVEVSKYLTVRTEKTKLYATAPPKLIYRERENDLQASVDIFNMEGTDYD